MSTVSEDLLFALQLANIAEPPGHPADVVKRAKAYLAFLRGDWMTKDEPEPPTAA